MSSFTVPGWPRGRDLVIAWRMQCGYRMRMTAGTGHPADAGEYTAGGTAMRPRTGHNGLVNGEWRTAARGWLRAALVLARTVEPRSAEPKRVVSADVALAAGFLVFSLIEVARLGSPSSAAYRLIPGLPGGGGVEPR